MNHSSRRWGLPAVAVLLLLITLWNRGRGFEDASFGLYYLPIFAAALLRGVPGGLLAATLSTLGAGWTTLWHDGVWAPEVILSRPDLALDAPCFFVFAVLVASLAHRRTAIDTLARMDPLTGVFNRHSLLDNLSDHLHQARHEEQPPSLLLISIDHFARHNELHGEERCDEALRAIAAAMRRCIRAVDVPGRIKGKEFVVILPETPLDGALLVAERIRKAVQDFGDYSRLYMTVSVGVVEIDVTEALDPEDFVAQADEALYEARRTGRNRVVAFDPEMHHGLHAVQG